MFYEKIPNVSISDMCIWCDKHMYDEDVDDMKLFKYLYFISNCLAGKAKLTFFNGDKKYFDEFALFMAIRLWSRIKTKRNVAKIKSILNMAKAVLYPCRADFFNYYKVDSISIDEAVSVEPRISIKNKLDETIQKLNHINFRVYIEDEISDTIKQFVYNRVSYKKDSEIFHNIYMSCLLSMLNSMVLSNRNKKRLDKLISDLPFYIDQLYKEEQENCIILYKLDKSYTDYITVLVRELKGVIAEDLSSLLHDSITQETLLKNTLLLLGERKDDK